MTERHHVTSSELALIFLQEHHTAKMLSSFGKARILLSLLCIATIGLISRLSWDLSFFSFNIQNSSVCACHKCLKEGDRWFRERIRAAPQPFLSKTYTPSEADFNWWKRLQLEKRNFVFYKRTLDNLFKIFPTIPDVVKSSPDRCGTCAVVGNSGNLKGSGHGPLIDLHDIVIRMNRGRTKGYEADVGTKTTHHVMYPNSAINLDKTTHLVLFPFKINDLLWLLNQFKPGNKSAGNSTRIANKDLVMILNPAFIKYVHERWLDNNGYYPSTGFLTLALSLQICDEVSVFGFGADSDGKWGHYFEILKDKWFRTGIHAGGHEFNVIQQLYQRKQINFYKGS